MNRHLMKRFVTGATSVLLTFAASGSYASDAISSGTVSLLTMRESYVMFRLINSSGENLCAPCPPDPGNFNSGGYCWIPESEKAKLGTLYLARAQGITISGRVPSLATNCNMVQMTLRDG